MNKGNKNIFDETVKVLTNDAKILTEKYNKLVNVEFNPNSFVSINKASIDTLRLLKDTLSLIKEYDWHLEYSKNGNEICIWEQNHSGEIKNKKTWLIKEYCEEFWYKMFSYYIDKNESYLVDKNFSRTMRGSGKSKALAKLCLEYHGVVIYHFHSGTYGIRNRSKELGCENNSIDFASYAGYMRDINQYKNTIVFLDEGHGLSPEEIKIIKENNFVIGFEE